MIGDKARWALGYGTRKYKRFWVWLAALTVPTMLLAAVRPFLIRALIDDVIPAGEIGLLGLFLLGLVGAVALERFFGYLLNLQHIRANRLALAREQQVIYQRIQNAKPRWLARFSAGDIMTRVLSDLDQLAPVMATTVPALVLNAVHFMVILGVLFYFSWQMAAVVVVTVPLYYLGITAFSSKLQSESQKERVLQSELTEVLKENIEGIPSIKALSKERFFSRRLAESATQSAIQAIRSMKVYIGAQNITVFVTYVTPVLVLGYGGLLVMRGEMTLGTLIAFFSYMGWVYEPIQMINNCIIELKSLEPFAQRTYELYNAPTEETPTGSEAPKGRTVEVDHVWFSYDSSEPVLKDVTLRVEEGERVAIVGPTGAGKTTLVKLLPRFYDPDKGAVKVGGVDAKKLGLQVLRKGILLVSGSEKLFNMTVKENITLGDDVPEETLKIAVKLAKADEFTASLPQGYDTLIENGGANISDGQRQRILLARALLLNPKVLILDEATSGVDAETEEVIYSRLKSLDAALIIISHRLSTIKKADTIVVLDGGRVVSIGKHEELLSSCSLYRDVVLPQLVT